MKLMNIAYWVLRISTLLISLFMILWIFPLFLMPEEIGKTYLDWLFGMRGSQDPSRFAAIHFVYLLISLPIGVISLLVTELFWLIILPIFSKKDPR